MADERNPLESIASDFADSIRDGKQDSIEAVVESNPEMEGELRDLLPVIRQLEVARRVQAQRPGGLATLGASRPDQLGDFEIVRQIGRGGMGVVFEAVQRSLGRRVALKVMPKSLLSDGDQLARFQRESKTAAALHHTNIVPVFGIGEDQGFHYYVMQRIDGRGLDRLVTEDQERLSPEQVARLGVQAANALAYAHEQNVLHRDIKPANLIVNDQLDLWVTDFGVAKAIESEAVTRTGDVVGTLRYMAPEQIVGDADIRSDVYSLGITLYELLAGRPAMDDASIREALVSRRPAPMAPPLRTLNTAVPKDLETILHTAMAVEASARYQNANGMADDLQRFLDGEPISVRPLNSLQKIARWSKHNPAIASLSALLLLALTTVAVVSTIGFVQVQASLDRELLSRQRAEATAALASGALDNIFDRFSESPDEFASTAQFSSAPALSEEAAELLDDLMVYYDDLLARDDPTGDLRRSALNARYAMGDIRFKLGDYVEAIAAFQAALDEEPNLRSMTDDERRMREVQIRNQIGLSYRMIGRLDEAREQHRQSLGLLLPKGVDENSLSNQQRFQIARSHFLLGFHLLPGMSPSAMPPLESIALLNRELANLREFAGAPPKDPWKLLDESIRESRPPRRRELPESDSEELDKAARILRSLHQSDPDDLGYALALATTLQYQNSGDQESSASSEQESISLLRELYERHPENDMVRFELGSALSHLDTFNVRDEDVSWLTLDRLQEATEHFVALSEKKSSLPQVHQCGRAYVFQTWRDD